MPQIDAWLADLGLSKYTSTFASQEVDFEALTRLSEIDLREIGLPLGPRRKILNALAEGDRALSQQDDLGTHQEAERRQLTVMFVDLVGSTELSQRFDPEEMRDVIAAYQRAVSTEVFRHGGYVAKLMGDGVLAYFGWPQAHEDDAERAIRAGLATVAALSELEAPEGVSIAARVGISTGLVVVGDMIGEGAAQEEAVVGEAPNLAARLQAIAEPNSVVIAELTRQLASGGFEFAELNRQHLKGFAAPVAAWKALRETAVESRFDARHAIATPLIGRSSELHHLLQRWEMASSGHGQTVLVVGEAGIGKSHLIARLQEEVEEEARTLRCHCSPDHLNSAFYPLAKLLERTAGLRRRDSDAAKLSKLKSLLDDASCNQAETKNFVAELLGIQTQQQRLSPPSPPQGRRQRTAAALSRIIFGLAARWPLLMVIEDVHWVDPTSREWLEDLVPLSVDLPILLVLSLRSELAHSWEPPHGSKLSLGRLSLGDSAALAQQIAGSKELPREVKERILANSEGVPLFVEEVTKAAIDHAGTSEGGLSSNRLASAVPATLAASLMARLDRLGGAKELAQTGACIGRSFHFQLIARLRFRSSQLTEGLQRLEHAELLQREGTPPDAIYTFKHALIQKAAYESLLRRRRREIHGQIAAVLESEFGEVVSREPETLAHHHALAGSVQNAVSYWLRAGQQALKNSANLEAIAHLQNGIEALASMPASRHRDALEFGLQAALGIASMGAKGFGSPDVLAAMSRARILSERLNDNRQLFTALCGEASYHMISGHLREANALGLRCMAIAEDDGDEGLLLEAHHRQWATAFFMGDYPVAEQHLLLGLKTYQPDRHHHLTFTHTGHDPGVCCRSYSAQVLWLRGYPDQAVERARQALTLAERVSHPLSVALAAKNLSEIHLWRREPDLALELIGQWEATSTDLVLPLLTTQARFQRGWALLEQSKADAGVEEMREGIAAIRATGASMGMQHFLSILARGYAALDRPDAGLAVLEEGLKIAQDTGAAYQYPELLRTKGEILLQLDPKESSAEGWLAASLTAAREEGTKMLELRAAVSLARSLHESGKHRQAQEALGPVHEWFTEGRTTHDLQDAQRLLDELP